MNKNNCQILEIRNPYNNQWLGEVCDTSPTEIDTIIEKGKKAQKNWKQVPIYHRVELVKNFLSLVEKEQESLSKTLSMESGKPINQARKEISNIPIAWNAFSEKIKHLYDTVFPGEMENGQEKNFTFTKREPLGIVACILPFNFPCNLFNQKVAPTLLAGNAAIIKPPCQNPITICRLTSLLIQAGFPEGIAQVVTGPGDIAGKYLCSHPEIQAISLTGSTQVGIQVAETAGKTLKTLSLELGGNDAFLLLKDGDVELAAKEAVTGRFYNAGQICCAPKRFFIHKNLYEPFVHLVMEKTKALICGDPLKEETEMGTVIDEKAAEKIHTEIQHTLSQGAKLLFGGNQQGAFVEPTILVDVPHHADILHNLEVFGPVIPITFFEAEEEALFLANDTMFGLGAGVFTKDMEKAMYFSKELQAGNVVINGSSYFRSFEIPFCGYKYSGLGSEGVSSTFFELTRTKCITWKGIY